MERLRVATPDRLDLLGALTLSRELVPLVGTVEQLVVDFSSTKYAEPFGLLLTSALLSAVRSDSRTEVVECANYKHLTYPAHMGFFQSFGEDFGKFPGAAPGSPTYVPMTLKSVAAIQAEADKRGCDAGEVVEIESAQLAAMLCRSESGDVFDTLTYSIREVMRNVVEHSEASVFGLCAQYWSAQQKVEVAIYDPGIGVKKSLQPNTHIDANTDKRAINYALLPGISGKAFKGAPKQRRGDWNNSGFGLYMTSRICRNGGSFMVASGDTAMLLSGNKRYFECNVPGTAVRMVIRTKNLKELKEALATYRSEGYQFAEEYQKITRMDPSAASMMLSADFERSIWEKVFGGR